MPDGEVDVGVAGVPGVPEEAGVTTATEVLDMTGVVGVMGVFGDIVEAAFVITELCVFSVVRHRNKTVNNNTDMLL